ncbi:MAG: hypothetical protein DMG55_31125 [Acidobacteria bacterium]|nr:MAG: hypothetical protein DMG55_31125 [Acidobacteriota bacterium]
MCSPKLARFCGVYRTDGPRRTSELKRSIPGITERMLIRHLQELVADGIVKRDDKKTIPTLC